MSSSAADSGDTQKAGTYGKIAVGLNVAGILVTILCIVIPVAVAVSAAARHNNNDNDDDCAYTECGGDCCSFGDSCCYGTYSGYYCC